MPPVRAVSLDARSSALGDRLSAVRRGCGEDFGSCSSFHLRRRLSARLLLRKEVIQPLVPQRLPCYDFIPITTHTLDGYPPCGLARRLRVQTAFMM